MECPNHNLGIMLFVLYRKLMLFEARIIVAAFSTAIIAVAFHFWFVVVELLHCQEAFDSKTTKFFGARWTQSLLQHCVFAHRVVIVIVWLRPNYDRRNLYSMQEPFNEIQ